MLLAYGDTYLTYKEVINKIPAGIAPEDSVALFHSIIDEWLESEVLSDFAEERILDLNSIDRQVRNYRNSLIVQTYLTRMRETQNPMADELKVRDYYDKHRSELKLEVPLVKGIFLKVNVDAKGKENLKKLLESDDPSAIDELENEWLDRALQYSYFRDKWTDWESVASMIPYRFGDPETFLESNNFFETDDSECTYYLKITDYLSSGEEQPYEYASKWINGLLTRGELEEYEHALVESIVRKAIKDKKLRTVGYDPFRHELKKNNVKEEEEL